MYEDGGFAIARRAADRSAPRRSTRRHPESTADRAVQQSGRIFHRRRLPEDIHGHQGTRPRRNPRLDLGWINGESERIDVCEHRGRPLVENAVGGGRKAERSGDHLISRSNSSRSKANMKPCGTTAHADSSKSPGILGHGLFQLVDSRAHAEPRRSQNFHDRPDVLFRDPRLRERNIHFDSPKNQGTLLADVTITIFHLALFESCWLVILRVNFQTRLHAGS